MNVLVLCEKSGMVRRAFAALGHTAVSVDTEPAQGLTGGAYGRHWQRDALEVVGLLQLGWFDLMIAHPECRYLCSSGLFRNIGNPERQALTQAALAFALALWQAPVKYKCMENSVGLLTRTMRERGHPVQIVQPYEFGDDASKQTGLILHNLPLLTIDPAKRRAGRIVVYKGREYERWSNQTDSGQNKLGPSADRSAKRAVTYPGIANAIAQQFGGIQS